MTLAATVPSPIVSANDRAAFVAAPEAMAFAAIVERIGALFHAWQERRLHAKARREFARLSPAAMRDLGMDASEFESYWAEARGQSLRTRRRIQPLYAPAANR